jgi:signal transduction histidine kinase
MSQDLERMMRHDIRNHVHGVINGVKLLERREGLTEEHSELMDLIREQAFLALNLLERYGDLSRMESGDFTPQREEVDLTSLMRSVEAKLVDLEKSKSVELRYQMQGGPLDQAEKHIFYGEATHLENMLTNLVKNAVEAAPQHTAVTVSVTEYEDRQVVDIHNRGEVPEGVRDDFFKRYVTSDKQGGTGLGTYIAKLVAQAHGGDISYTTSPEEGTHVYVTLPKQGSC